MLYIYSANTKEGKLQGLYEWLKSNEERIKKNVPAGWTFSGIYAPAFGFGDKLIEIHWTIETYAAFDQAWEAASTNGEYQKIVAELYDFLDVSSQSARLLRHFSDPRTLVVAK